MNALGEGFVAYLATISAVTDLVATRIYPLQLPQKPTLPAIRYFTASETRPQSTRGALGQARVRLQVDACGVKYSEAVALAKALRLALVGYRGPWGDFSVQGVIFEAGREFFEAEPSPGYNIVSRDYMVWHTEEQGVRR